MLDWLWATLFPGRVRVTEVTHPAVRPAVRRFLAKSGPTTLAAAVRGAAPIPRAGDPHPDDPSATAERPQAYPLERGSWLVEVAYQRPPIRAPRERSPAPYRPGRRRL